MPFHAAQRQGPARVIECSKYLNVICIMGNTLPAETERVLSSPAAGEPPSATARKRRGARARAPRPPHGAPRFLGRQEPPPAVFFGSVARPLGLMLSTAVAYPQTQADQGSQNSEQATQYRAPASGPGG